MLLKDAQLLSGTQAQHAAKPTQPPPTPKIAAPTQPPPPLRSPPKAVTQGKGKAQVTIGFQVATAKRKPGVKVATDHYTPAQLADVGLMVANKQGARGKWHFHTTKDSWQAELGGVLGKFKVLL